MVKGANKEGKDAGKEQKSGFVKWFSELSNKDVSIAGGKGASLAEMYNIGMPVPPGFIITAQSYQYLIEKAGLKDRMIDILKDLDIEDTEKLEKGAAEIRELISSAEMPKEMEEEIVEAYDILDTNKKSIESAKGSALEILKNSHEPPFVAVRSSSTAEDLAEASFAGQQESFLNVKGKKDLIQKVKECFASLFTARATYYRQKKGFSHETTYLAVVVQKMINSDKSGVMFTMNPVGEPSTILIEAVWGLGEGIVSGRIKPDSYTIDGNLEKFNILETRVPEKKVAITRDSSGNTVTVKLSHDRGKQQVLTNYELKRLSQYGKQLEEHYKKPQDIEFAVEGDTIYVVQSRPITTKAASKKEMPEIEGEVLLSGLAASPGIASGIVKIIRNLNELSKIKGGDVLVTKMTNPDMVVTMQKSAAIVTDEGGVTSHAAIVSREMGIPAVVGTEHATSVLSDGMIITVDGNSGRVYEGKKETKLAEVKPIVPTKTKIKVIVDLPEFAQRAALSQAKAIGLTRIEGIIASSGKHPVYFVKQKKIEDYIEILYQGLRKIAEPFEEIWVRSSDIRSDEYRNLEGSPKDIEGNPMLGDHGIRFSLRHPEILTAELTAIKEVADEFPKKKIGIMFPQVISVAEIKEAKRIANEIGMPKNIKIGIMVETPAAVQIINSLCEEGIDFASFGSNDLTQYTLAIDRNNENVQYIYDEMNPAVLNSLSYVIRRCKKYGVESSICGQAGSKEEMVRFLVREGIDSISVNADAAEKISKLVAELEKGAGIEMATKMPEEIADGREIMKEAESGEEQVAKEDVNSLKIDKKEILTQDIEEVILKELEGEQEKALGEERAENKIENTEIKKDEIKDEEDEDEAAEDGDGGEDYIPGMEEKKGELPSLNDAIPVDSELLEEKEQEEELDLSELKPEDEWKPKEDKKVDIF